MDILYFTDIENLEIFDPGYLPWVFFSMVHVNLLSVLVNEGKTAI